MTIVRPLGLALLIALAACSKTGDKAATPVAATPNVPPPAGKQWTDIVSKTEQGGMVIGNPNAPVKVIEYASYTCPHCAHFENEGAELFQQKYISTGKVSWEFRSFLIHGAPDVAATLLMNCRGPETFFAMTKQLYAAQDEWVNKMFAMPAAQQQALQSQPPAAQFKAWTEAGGLYGFLGVRGLPRAQADACLSDQAAIDQLAKNQDHATNVDQINQTPTFIINGEKQDDVANWEQLDGRLSELAK